MSIWATIWTRPDIEVARDTRSPGRARVCVGADEVELSEATAVSMALALLEASLGSCLLCGKPRLPGGGCLGCC